MRGAERIVADELVDLELGMLPFAPDEPERCDGGFDHAEESCPVHGTHPVGQREWVWQQIRWSIR